MPLFSLAILNCLSPFPSQTLSMQSKMLTEIEPIQTGKPRTIFNDDHRTWQNCGVRLCWSVIECRKWYSSLSCTLGSVVKPDLTNSHSTICCISWLLLFAFIGMWWTLKYAHLVKTWSNMILVSLKVTPRAMQCAQTQLFCHAFRTGESVESHA